MIKYILIFSLISCNSIFAQNFKQDVDAMYKAYSNLNTFKTVVTVKNFNEDKMLAGSLSITLKKLGNSFLHEANDYTMLLNQKMYLMIIHNYKSIAISKISDNDRKKMEQAMDKYNPSATIDSLLKNNVSVTFEGINNQSKKYKLSYKNGMYDYVNIYINQNTKLIDKMEFKVNSKLDIGSSFVEVVYQNDLNVKFDSSLFDESQFLILKNKQYSGVGKYANFTVVDNTKQL